MIFKVLNKNYRKSIIITRESSNIRSVLKKIFPFVDFDNKPKTPPGRWGNVGSFAECDKRKNTREHWASVITTQDHCGDVLCGKEKSIIEAQKIIKSKN